MREDLKARIRRHELALGSWITIGHPAVAEIMAKAGFDWLVIDLEHSVIDLHTAGELIRIIDLCGVAPLVRLTSNDPDQIKRVMDAGAQGIVVPMVKSERDATLAVSATRYAPQGSRGVGLSRAQGYGTGFPDYLIWQRDGPVVIVQIEHVEAIAHLTEILTVAGVDGFIIGPYDLSCSLGVPGEFEHPDFIAAMARIRSIGRGLGCPAGLHVVEPNVETLARAVREGYTFIGYSVDMRVIDVGLRCGIAALREPPK